MKDVRRRAEERARRRQEETRPPGSGFMSERTRAKEALRAEVNTYKGENVRKIAATAEEAEEERILRVAAYCRVSTDDIDQLVSIEMQKNAYRDMIRGNPRWKHVGTYVDDGFSGTNTEHRPAFQLMMKDAVAGKIEISRSKIIQTHFCEHARKPLEIRHFAAVACFFNTRNDCGLKVKRMTPSSQQWGVFTLQRLYRCNVQSLRGFQIIVLAMRALQSD